MIIAFEALIRKISTKSLRSMDKNTEVTLEFNSNDETVILNALNVLQRADGLVYITIMDDKEPVKNNGKQ